MAELHRNPNCSKESLVTVNENGALDCVLCDCTLVSLEQAMQHLESDHLFDPATLGFFLLEVGASPFAAANGAKVLPPSVFSCDYCCASFISYKGMKQHVGKVHLGQKKLVKCTNCGCRFKHKYALKCHMKQVHEKSTRVECQVCHKVLYNKYYLKKHTECCRGSSAFKLTNGR